MGLKQIMLGKKIKELRQQKKMTQAELAGDTITRNMLSQIENGVAQPSVTTMMELAEKLGVPTEYFFSESTDLDAFRKIGAIAKIKKLYATGEYAKCLARLEALGISDDETEYLFARSAFERGLALYREGYLTGASVHFEKSLSHAVKTIYLDESFSSAVKQCLFAATAVRSKGDATPVCDCDMTAEADFKADIAYISSIFGEAFSFEYGEKYDMYARHLAVRTQLQKPEQEQDTLAMMKTLQTILDSASETRYAVLRYYVLCDLETLAGRTGDYKCAYECSSARLLLAEKMNH